MVPSLPLVPDVVPDVGRDVRMRICGFILDTSAKKMKAVAMISTRGECLHVKRWI